MIHWLFAKTIYRNEQYLVKQSCRYRWLMQPDGTIHTRIYRKHPGRPALDYMHPMIKYCQQDNANILMLGLGGGGLLHAIQSRVASPHFDIVDIDADMVSISRQFFYLDNIKSKTIFTEDAAEHVQKCTNKYHYIFVDLYHDKNYPRHCMSIPFFNHCQRCLHQDGLILINCANISQYQALLNQLQRVFARSLLTIRINHPRNLILIASMMPLNAMLNLVPLTEVSWHQALGVVARL